VLVAVATEEHVEGCEENPNEATVEDQVVELEPTEE
jgi:hypothetical protein